MRVKRLQKNCAKCPLRDGVRVWSEAPDGASAKIVIIGEAPGEREVVEGRPFCGPAGGVLNCVLTEAEIMRRSCYVMNVISCRPPQNDIKSMEAELAIECCKEGFEEEVRVAIRNGARVLLPLGTTAQSAVGIGGSITRNRGSVFEYGGLPTIPTYHPSYILRGQQREEPTWIADFKKAKSIAKSGWRKPVERFNTKPSLKDVHAFVNRCVKNKTLVAVDLETTGLSPDRSEIFVIGLAEDGERALSVPFFSFGGKPYWEAGEEREVRVLLQHLFTSCQLLFQNALFDVLHLMKHGFKIERRIHDALLLHHAIHPELPHNLGYIVSIYGQTPYWKDGVLRRAGSLSSVPDKTLRTYNLRDAVVLHQIYGPLLEDARELDVEAVYRDVSAPLVPVLTKAILRGIRVDVRGLERYKRGLQKALREEEEGLRKTAELPSAFNLGSGEDLRLLFYGFRGAKFERAEAELKKYDLNTKLRKDTKKYKELLALSSVSKNTVSLWSAPRQKRTESGKLSTDDEALLSLQIAATGRLEYIKSLKRDGKKYAGERALIERTLTFLALFRKYQETDKMLSTYTSFPPWQDGRVHANFTIHGTATGRLSSSKPNMQNIPKEVRSVFVADPGNIFIQADYSNLELRVLAAVSGDEPMLRAFQDGLNIHDENTKALFGLTPEDVNWKAARKASKVYIFGRNYGGGLQGIYERVCKEVPDLPLTFSAFCAADRAYRAAHPAYGRWVQATQQEVLKTHALRNVFGRQRIFLGTSFEIMREGLNFPIQSAAADIVNRAMIGIHEDFMKKKMKACMLVQVHDSLLVECPKGEREEVIRVLRKNMERTFHILGKDVVFRVDIEEGTSWYPMKAVEGKS